MIFGSKTEPAKDDKSWWESAWDTITSPFESAKESVEEKIDTAVSETKNAFFTASIKVGLFAAGALFVYKFITRSADKIANKVIK